MAQLENSRISCGVKMLFGFYTQTPIVMLRSAWRTWKLSNRNDSTPLATCAHIVFSDRTGGQGEKLVAFIKKNKLGTVTASPAEENPNSHNPITVWTWTPIKPETERIIAGRAKAVKVAK